MTDHKQRIKRLESVSPRADAPLWAALIGEGRAILAFEDGRRVEIPQDEIPGRCKVYGEGWNPDVWGQHEQP